MTTTQREISPNSSWAVTWRELIVPLLTQPAAAADPSAAWWTETGIVGAYRRPHNDMPWRWGD